MSFLLQLPYEDLGLDATNCFSLSPKEAGCSKDSDADLQKGVRPKERRSLASIVPNFTSPFPSTQENKLPFYLNQFQ